jgi:hypothetical protein
LRVAFCYAHGAIQHWQDERSEDEVRSPKSEVRSPKSEVRSPKSEVQNSKSEVVGGAGLGVGS